MSNKHLLVTFIVIAMAVWMFSGEFAHNTVTADEASEAVVSPASDLTLVRGIESVAQPQVVHLDVRGQTRANREVQVKAEVAGRIEALPGEKGTHVARGDLLCKLAEDARGTEHEQALAELESATLEYEGLLDLNKKGLQSEVMLAKAKAALKQSKTRAKQAELALRKTEIVAPFDGIVADQSVEIGDYLTPGNTCVSLIEVNPVLIAGQVAEKNIGSLKLDDEVDVELITGEKLNGIVSYIGHKPEKTTRTFPIEVTVANPAWEVRTGLTATMRVPVAEETVHLISAASLVLNDAGIVGVRIVDADSRVRFIDVQVVNESYQGVWVKGLPEKVSLITVGHEEVIEGQEVRIDFTPVTALAANPL